MRTFAADAVARKRYCAPPKCAARYAAIRHFYYAIFAAIWRQLLEAPADDGHASPILAPPFSPATGHDMTWRYTLTYDTY